MKSIQIKMKNCYGIKSLEETLSLDNNNRNGVVIYASNGTMKTSFTKSFKDLSEGNKPSKDMVYNKRQTERVIKNDDGVDIQPKQVFVIERYNEEYESKKISTLLVNKPLKEKYDTILKGIEDAKDNLLTAIKEHVNIDKKKIEQIVSQVFMATDNSFLMAIGRISSEVLEAEKYPLFNIQYNKIFNPKVDQFLETQDFKKTLKEYMDIYEDLLNKSTFLKKGIFNHYQASEVAKSLKDHGFFKADHSIYLTSKNKEQKISNEGELEEMIEEEKQRILTDQRLSDKFNTIDKKLKNKELREFRDYLSDNKNILTELSNPTLLKHKLWKDYFGYYKDLFRTLSKQYEGSKEAIKDILEGATNEAPKWQEVLNIFNQRFSVPFKVSISNQKDVVVGDISPVIAFQFLEDEENDATEIHQKILLEILSNGEKRALYLLNIIFEIEARKEQKIKTTFIIDDIADSFDYKNKYAIIEYLNDMLDDKLFSLVILTHNYDFYRTVSSRLNLRSNRIHAIKTKHGISFIKDKTNINPFEEWKNSKVVDDKTIALIPFAREIAKYVGNTNEVTHLTSLLHIKENTESITIGKLYEIFQKVLNIKPPEKFTAKEESVKKFIYDTANTFVQSDPSGDEMSLEKKISLSIAIRLKAEEFLINKLNMTKDDLKKIDSGQTFSLFSKFKKKFKSDLTEKKSIKTIERVMLITPENIHLNSFMYEPILDLSTDHLVNLYSEVSKLKIIDKELKEKEGH